MKFEITEVREIEIEDSFPIYRKGTKPELHYFKVISSNEMVMVACSINEQFNIASISYVNSIGMAFKSDTTQCLIEEFNMRMNDASTFLNNLANGDAETSLS